MQLESVVQDIRNAMRSLRKTPVITGVTTVTLAIAIACVSAVYSFVNSVYYRPLPYPEADRIVALSAVTARGYTAWSQLPTRLVELFRHESRSFERVAALQEQSVTLSGRDEPVLISRTAIDTAVLALIGATVERGRLISRSDILERAPVALISDSLWRSGFGARLDIAGQILRLDDVTYEIVGVLRPGLRFYEHSDVLVPLIERPDSLRAGDGQMFVTFGKLRDGVSVEQARGELARMQSNLSSADPEFKRWRLLIRDRMMSRAGGIGPAARAWMFVGVAMCLLLIACANVANLLFVRAAERRTEAAVRVALGASRTRLIRESLSESLVLGCVSGALGVLLTAGIIRLFTGYVPTYGLPAWVQFGIDGRVLGFTVAMTLVAVAAIGLKPAVQATRVELQSVLKSGGQSVISNKDVMASARRGIVLEIAISVMLLVGAGLLWHSYSKLTSLDVGFDANQVLDLEIAPDKVRFADDRPRSELFRGLAQRISEDSRVQAVALRTSGALLSVDARERDDHARATIERPLSYDDEVGIFLRNDPTRSADHDLRPQVLRYGVSDSYFHVFGQPIIRGRGFATSDREGSPPVAVVSEQFARAVWKKDNVIGQTFSIGRNGTPITVIGVARDVLQPLNVGDGLTAVHLPSVYLPERQSVRYEPRLFLRSDQEPRVLRTSVAAAVHQADPNASITRFETVGQETQQAAVMSRLAGSAIGIIALCSLFLATVGVYSVVSYAISQRTREVGLRLAIGATPEQLVRLFLREGMWMIARGLGLGVILALAASQLLRAFLLNVSPFDLVSYCGVLSFFGVVTLLACWLPARRVTRVDPAVALRAE